MKQAEIVGLSKEEIVDQIEATQKQLSQLRLTNAVSPLENPRTIKETKKTIARLNTELTKRNKADKA